MRGMTPYLDRIELRVQPRAAETKSGKWQIPRLTPFDPDIRANFQKGLVAEVHPVQFCCREDAKVSKAPRAVGNVLRRGLASNLVAPRCRALQRNYQCSWLAWAASGKSDRVPRQT